MSGDSFHQYGAGSIGKATHSGSGDIVTGGKHGPGPEAGPSALAGLLKEIEELRRHLDASDRAEVDATVEEIRSNPSEERFGRLLRRIAGIAAVIGEAGVPVIATIKALLGPS
ncbi:hypothetical protein [Streptomyces sp. NPDC050548]|uniref:hypothetical protein n=1 Tax=Streptomyces sp. NPDC050548 TaxID=3365629 RepID=UPI0037B1E7D9